MKYVYFDPGKKAYLKESLFLGKHLSKSLTLSIKSFWVFHIQKTQQNKGKHPMEQHAMSNSTMKQYQ